MTRVLLVAHHANPARTSEPLIGWHWARELDDRVDLTLVTHVRNRADIESAGGLRGAVHYVDTERIARTVNRVNDRLFPSSGSVNRLLLETVSQWAFDRGAVAIARDRIERGQLDLIQRVSPISPRYSTRLGRLGVPFVIGPLNGGMRTPDGFASVAATERQRWLALRRFAGLLDPGGRSLASASALLVANETTRAALPLALQSKAEVVCENAVEIERFQPSYARQDASGLRVLFLGRLLPYKGVQFALRALSQAPTARIRLDIVGDGDHRPALQTLAHELGLAQRVHFHGNVPHADVPKHLERCDALVLPSIRESGGAVPLEAMACGKPVIVADHGGPAETVTEGTGLRISCASEQELVDGLTRAFVRLEQNEEERNALGRAARRHVEQNYTWAAKADAALSVYARCLRLARSLRPEGKAA